MKNSSVDVVVIGSGIGGLSCAALLARYGFEVTVCESHAIPGGAAHAFERAWGLGGAGYLAWAKDPVAWPTLLWRL